MGKLDGLRKRVGNEFTDKLLHILGEKEVAALESGMTPKEEGATEAPTEPAGAIGSTADVTALAGAFAEALKPIGLALEKMNTRLDGLDTEAKEIKVLSDKLVALDTTIKSVEVTAKEAKDGVVELKGEQPGGAGFRASQSGTTVTDKAVGEPAADPLNSWINDFMFPKAK